MTPWSLNPGIAHRHEKVVAAGNSEKLVPVSNLGDLPCQAIRGDQIDAETKMAP